MKSVETLLLLCLLAACGTSSKESARTTEQKEPTKPVEPETPPAGDCGNYEVGTNLYSDFLCAHNDARAAVQPAPATPLPALAWNDDLVTVAQAWAEKCIWDHNPNRSDEYNAVTGEGLYVGENLYLSTFASVSPYDAVAAWASEAEFFDYAANTCATGEMCGHYTQLMWADTLDVGCAQASCAAVAGSEFTNATMIVCNYGPGGNIVGEKPY